MSEKTIPIKEDDKIIKQNRQQQIQKLLEEQKIPI